MFVTTSDIVVYLLPFACLLGLYYIYSLYNLYIGNNTKKYKIIAIAYNFLFLIFFIIALISYPLYDSPSGIILMILLLIIIALGIIGGFMYDEKICVTASDSHLKALKIFNKTIKITTVIAIITSVAGLTYNLLTHEVERTTHIAYISVEDSNEELWGLNLEFDTENHATLSFMYFDESINPDEIDGVTVYFGNNEIFSISEAGFNLYEQAGFYLDLEYDFQEAINLGLPSFIKVELLIDSLTEEYVYLYPDYSINKQHVTVPIWVKA